MEVLGTTLFCDDIRFEKGNKITLVGCYGVNLILRREFPTTLAKLGLLVQLRMPKGAPPVSKILVHLPGKSEEEAVQVTVGPPKQAAIDIVNRQSENSDDVMLLATNVPIVLNMVALDGEGLIKVRAICGDNVVKCGTLKITRQPPQAGEAVKAATPDV